MRVLFLCAAAIVVFCGAAADAGEKNKSGKEQLWFTDSSRGELDCSGATMIGCNETLYGETNVGWPNNVEYYSGIIWAEAGGERVYELTVAAGTDIIVALNVISGDPDVFLLGSCDESVCLAFGNVGFPYFFDSGGTYYIVVDGYGSDPDCVYDLSVTCEPGPSPNLDCMTAAVIDCGTTLYGETNVGWPNNVEFYYGSTWHETGGERIYELSVPNISIIDISLDVAYGDPDIILLGTCDEATCLNVVDWNLSYLIADPGIYYIVVDGHYSDPECGYDLTVTCEEVPPPPANDTCEGAPDLTGQGTAEFVIDLCDYSNQYNAGFGGYTGWCALGPEAVYRINLDAGDCFQAGVVHVDEYIDLSLYLISDCDDPAGSCVAGSDEFWGGPFGGDSAETIEYLATEAGSYYMMVDSYRNCGGGLTEVGFNVVPPPSNDTCEGAVDLIQLGQQSFMVDLCAYSNRYDPGDGGCTGREAQGPDASFLIDLNEDDWFRASIVHIDEEIDLSLYLIMDCEDPVGSCVAGSDYFRFPANDAPEYISFRAPSAGSYFMIVDSHLDCGNGVTSAWFSNRPPPDNDSCEGAVDLAEQGLHEFAIDLRDYTNHYDSYNSIGQPAEGPEAIYRIDLELDEFLSVRVEEDVWYMNPAIYLATDCYDLEGSCVAGGVTENPISLFYHAIASGAHYLTIDCSNSGGPVEVFYETYGPYVDLVAHYPFNGSAEDRSGYGHDGEVFGATLTTDRFGIPNSAYLFDGSDDWIKVSNNGAINISGYHSMTLCAWIKCPDYGQLSQYAGVITKWGPGSQVDDQYILHFRDGILAFGLGEEADFLHCDTTDIHDWMFVTGVYDAHNQVLELYVNADLVASSDLYFNIRDTNRYLEIGGHSGDWFFAGALDDVRIYRKALNAEEVLELYKAPDLSDVDRDVPRATERLSCYPNPFNPQVTIVFSLPRVERVELGVYDLMGRLVYVLADHDYIAGDHSVVWNGKDGAGRAVPSGSYVVRMETGSGVETQKVSLIR